MHLIGQRLRLRPRARKNRYPGPQRAEGDPGKICKINGKIGSFFEKNKNLYNRSKTNIQEKK